MTGVLHQVSVEEMIAGSPSLSKSPTSSNEGPICALDHAQATSRWKMVSAEKNTRKWKTTPDSKVPGLERMFGDGGSEKNWAREVGDEENLRLSSEFSRSVICVGPKRPT